MNKDDVIKLIRDGYRLSAMVFSDGETGVEVFMPNERIPEIAVTIQFNREQWEDVLSELDDLHIKVPSPDGLTKALVRKSQRTMEQHIVWEAYRRDNFTCQYCGHKDRPLTVDHYTPRELGGSSTLENLKTSCRPCNKLKGSMPPGEWEEYRMTKGLIYNT